MTAKVALFFLVAMCLTVGTSVSAQQPEQKFSVSMSSTFSFNTTQQGIQIHSVSAVLGARYKLSDGLLTGLEVPFSFVALHREKSDDETSYRFGNPSLSVGVKDDGVFGAEGSLLFRVGIPLATFPGDIPGNRIAELNYDYANSASGWQRPDLWLMNMLPVSLEGTLGIRVTPSIRISCIVSPSYLISVNSEKSGISVTARASTEVTVFGTSITAGWNIYLSTRSIENNNFDQHSIFAGFRWGGSRLPFTTEVVVNLDEPNGVFRKHGVKPDWGIVFKSDF